MFVLLALVIRAGRLAVAHPEELGGVEIRCSARVEFGADLIEVLSDGWFFGKRGSIAGDFAVIIFDAATGGVFDADAGFSRGVSIGDLVCNANCCDVWVILRNVCSGSAVIRRVGWLRCADNDSTGTIIEAVDGTVGASYNVAGFDGEDIGLFGDEDSDKKEKNNEQATTDSADSFGDDLAKFDVGDPA